MEDGEIIAAPERLPADWVNLSPTEHFYQWERRGRGWQLWNAPTYLEPPFRPFIRIPASVVLPVIDDGRRHTWLSLLIEKATEFLTGRRDPATETQMVDPDVLAMLAEPALPPYEDEDELVEIQLILPPEAKVTSDIFSAFLLSLSYCSYPLSFEVIGNSETIMVQLVCRERDAGGAKQQLAAHFPEALITHATNYFRRLWLENTQASALVVEFGLSREFMLPLKTLAGSAVDPLVAVTGALSGLCEGEIGVLQVLFEPVRHPWAESIFRAITNDEGRAFFSNAPEVLGFAKQKIASPLYAAVVRVAGKADAGDRALQIARSLGGGLTRLASSAGNELIPLENDGYDPVQHETDLILRLTHRGGMLLNADELVSLVHLPSPSVRSPKLKRLSQRTKAAPKSALGHSVTLGENENDGKTSGVSLSADQRIRHMHVIGASGTGKSTFLLNLILQDIEQGNGLAVLDPHGDLIHQIMERIPEERHEDVILIDPSDEEYPIGFNILSAHSEIEKHLLSSDLVSVFKRLSTSWGDQMTSVLGNAILAFLESERGGTLSDLRRFLIEKDYRHEFLKTVRDSEVVYYWQKEFPLLAGKPQAPLLTRLDTFLRPKLIRYMVAQRENKLDFAEIMNGGKIFLAKLAQGAIGEENAYLLGSLIVSKFHQMTLSRQEQRESERRPFFLYIDEFHNFITPSMAQILSGARKYRLGLILAHQELRQLGGASSDIASAVLSNPYTRVCFRVGDDDARKLESGFSFFEAKDLQNLGTGEALCRIERAEYDFNLRTGVLPPIGDEVGRERQAVIAEFSRRKYAARRSDVEAELAENVSRLDREEPISRRARDRGEAKNDESASRAEPPEIPSRASAPATPLSFEGAIKLRREKKPEGETGTVEDASTKKGPGLRTEPVRPAPLGRGGAEHQHLQRLIKQWAKGMGWLATIEKPILGGAGSVDVALEKSGLAVACEISVTTGVDQEFSNIQKCLRAGFIHVAIVSTDAKHLNRIREMAERKLGTDVGSKVRFCSTEELFVFIETLETESMKREAVTTKGMKVKVNFHAAGAAGTEERKSSLSQTLLKSIRKPPLDR